jgi:tripartite-type tricarboxylate transporter receptor subunit TctC
MTLPRRRFLHLAAAAAASPALPRVARAQSYPSRPIHLIVGFPPAGAGDITARLEGQWLTQRLGKTVVVENRSGAGGNIGTEFVVRSPADGYTLFLANTANAVNASLYEKINFDFRRDIAAVGGIARAANVMEVHPSVPARSVAEFIAYAKANPGKINFASSGNGTLTHVSAELFKMMAGVDMVHVPYRGAQALTALLAGEVQVMFVPGYEASGWYGIGAPRQTPAEVIETLNREINSGGADAQIRARFADLGCTTMTGSPADFAAISAADTEKWAKVVKFSGAKAE